MKIVVLAGGISTERSVSIVSGTMVCRALREKGHRAILVDAYCGVEPGPADRGSADGAGANAGAESALRGRSAAQEELTAEWFPETYDVEAAAAYMRSFDARIGEMKRTRRQFFGPNVLELCAAADVVFLALHGEDGEGGKVQAVFDLMGIRYTGSGMAGSAMAMDKEISRALFAQAGVPIAAGTVLRKGQEQKAPRENGVGLPCVVKPCCGGSSVGVEIARTPEEYARALENAFGYEEEVVVEQYIDGREFSVGVIGGRACPVIEIAPLEGFYDYRNKYQAGATVETCPADLPEEKTREMQRYAQEAYRALKLSCYARMDFMMARDGSLYCLEANTLPGMTPTSLLPQEAAADGMDFPALCEHLIEVSLRGEEER